MFPGPAAPAFLFHDWSSGPSGIRTGFINWFGLIWFFDACGIVVGIRTQPMETNNADVTEQQMKLTMNRWNFGRSASEFGYVGFSCLMAIGFGIFIQNIVFHEINQKIGSLLFYLENALISESDLANFISFFNN
jgi:hypothetical protein